MTKLDTSRTTWDLSPLLSGDDDPKIEQYRQEFEGMIKAFAAKWRPREDYVTNPAALKEALDEIEAIVAKPVAEIDTYYFMLRSAVDSTNDKLKAQTSKAEEFSQKVSVEIQFFWLNIGKIEPNVQQKMLKDASLKPYVHILEREFAAARYSLSEAEEKIMTLKSRPAHEEWVQMTADAISKDEREVIDESGKRIKAGEEQIIALIGSKQKSVRDCAAKVFNEMLVDHLDMGVAEINAILGNKKVDDELRGYERPDTSRLVRDDMEAAVVDALISAVAGHNDIAHRYYNLKTKLLGLPKMAYHERIVEYGDDTIPYPYQEACQLVFDTFSELDPEFATIFSTMLSRGQLDAYPRLGKRGGAFCASGNLAHTSYVLLNHTDRMRDVITIAHEMGHAIHFELMRRQQNSLNYGASMATAEVASTFMEDLIVQRLLKDADAEAELSLRVRQLDDVISTVFRQTAFYRFEQDLHRSYREKGYLSEDQIGELFRTHLDNYLGEAFGGAQDGKNWWLYIPHFRSFFYVYSYASGNLISKALQAKYRQDHTFIAQVKTFFEAGKSKSPKDIFADMGIDITDKSFWEQGLGEIDQLLKDTEALAKKLGKI